MLHEELTGRILNAAIQVHKVLGPCLSEASYQAAMALEMSAMTLSFEREPTLEVRYRGVAIGHHRPDFIVERLVIVELKSVARLDSVFTSQVLTYLKLTGLKVGLLINFNVAAIPFGLKRIVL
jgi:GxxExxY protein